MFFKWGKILSVGCLNKKFLGIVMLLLVGLFLVGCLGSKLFDIGMYFGFVYIVKWGDMLYCILCIMGISVKELVWLNGIFFFYIIEVG